MTNNQQPITVGIVGLGLIGGSLGLDLRSASNNLTVIGVSRSEATCKAAVEIGVADRASIHLTTLGAADIIFLCTPIDKIAPTLAQLVPYLSPRTIVTDVASVKVPIVRECSQLWTNFIGGHPMAGTEKQGIEAAQKGLFVGCNYVLTPTETTTQNAVDLVKTIISLLKVRIYCCSPEVHDCAVACISHAPVIVSAALIAALRGEADVSVLNLAKQIASSGFRDTSRVGGGNPELGLMMARYNRDNLLRSLTQYRHYFDEIITEIEAENWDTLSLILQQTQEFREEIYPSGRT
ncbi:MAG: prephenate/arogenate dehydrogenase [Snowella sp.]